MDKKIKAIQEQFAQLSTGPSGSGSSAGLGRARSEPPSRAYSPKLDHKTACSVEASGFPLGSKGTQVVDWVKANMDVANHPYKDLYSQGYRATKCTILFHSPEARRQFLGAIRDTPIDDRKRFEDDDGNLHKVWFNAKLSPEEGKRQMVQRRIKTILQGMTERSVVINVEKEDIGIEKGRGEVWVKNTVVAKVARNGCSWELTDDVTKHGFDKDAVKAAIAKALEEE